MSEGRSSWTIDCRKFADPDNDRSLRKHSGRNPRIFESLLESESYQALHSHQHDGMHWFFSSKNIVIMICRSGRHRSFANAEQWSNTLTRGGRHRHSVSLLHLSELDFWEVHVSRKLYACSLLESSRHHCDRVRAECSRLASVPDSLTDHLKRPRSENYSAFFLLKTRV